ncbi:MAG: hypothetical protein KDE20_22920 [Caldilineaceae bacterium]|nr:hypothetical protein [Caldilineaceae bacterium]
MPNNKKRRTSPATAPSGQHRIVVHATPRSEPDLRRLARALIELARQELEQEAADQAASPTDESGEAA